jgi:hypothetical protein
MAISAMWQDDLLKDQWAIMAKAYTILRDHFHLVSGFSLPEFVQLAARAMALPTAGNYITACGWEVTKMGSNISVKRMPRARNSTFVPPVPPAPVTVSSLVEMAKNTGYVMPRHGEWQRHFDQDGSV